MVGGWGRTRALAALGLDGIGFAGNLHSTHFQEAWEGHGKSTVHGGTHRLKLKGGLCGKGEVVAGVRN